MTKPEVPCTPAMRKFNALVEAADVATAFAYDQRSLDSLLMGLVWKEGVYFGELIRDLKAARKEIGV